MQSNLLGLLVVLVLFLKSPCRGECSQPLRRIEPADLSALSVHELQLSGDLRFYRHIDPVTMQGAASLYTDRKEIPLDFRQFNLDIVLCPGHYVIKGHWSKENRLVVTAARLISDGSKRDVSIWTRSPARDHRIADTRTQ
jgi:hypothetical protein